jgi:DNA-directed RNA polymerase subunit RPC12/RpoP
MSFDRLGDHRRQQAQDLFRLGRTCVKTGEKAEGRALLLKAVEYDRDLSDAWLWLTATTEDPAEQQKYLEWAIAAEPGNAQARRGLALLTGRLKPEELLPEGQSVEPRRPEAPQPAQVRRTFDCPQCGGRLRFDPELVDLKCQACGFVEVVEEVLLVDGARPLDFTLPTARGHRWAEGERRFTCQQCGAATLLPAGGKSTVCPFCGNAALVAAEEETDLVQPDGLIPMGLEAEDAAAAVRRWLGRGFFAPDDLAQLVKSRNLRPAYVPVWVFEATLMVKWSADVAEGYGRTRHWVHRTGEHACFFRDQLQPASRALPADLLQRLPPFDLAKLLAFKPEYLAEWPAALYDISLADASLGARAVMVKEAGRQVQAKVLSGREVRNLQVSTGSFSGELFKLALLPLWVGAYTYRGRLYRLLVNGQGGAVAGDKPLDGVKVGLVAAGVAFILVFLIYLFFFFSSR